MKHHEHKGHHMKHGHEHPGSAPREHFEHKISQAPVCGEKYAGMNSMSNPHDLAKAEAGLVHYAKKNKMKY